MRIVVGPRVRISCIGDTITVKLSLTLEQNTIHKLWLFFQPPAKIIHNWRDLPVKVAGLFWMW
jgi:hypothetical protein